MTNMYMPKVTSLLLCLHFISSISCLNNETITWPNDPASSKFTGMLLTKYGGHVIVTGTNEVYNINASNLMLLNSDTTGPYNASTDDNVKLMLYNQSHSGPEYVTTCSSTHNYCSIRNLDNIADVEWQLQKHVRKISGVQAFLVDSVHESERDSYLFVGCPHSKDQERLEDLCKAPGIFWYKNSGDEENDGGTLQSFKPYADSPVKTERFVAAFAVEQLRLFFSIQKQKNGTKIIRVAQVCQHYDTVNSKYTTPITYVDMPMKCGNYQEILDVKKVSVDNNTILVAVYTDTIRSAICIYNMSQVNKTFVDNIKICYKTGVMPKADEYYFRYPSNKQPCKGGNTENLTDEMLLCNTYNLESYHHMIGTRELTQDPVIQFNKTVRAVATATENSTIVVFLGTSDGTILKAKVYPTAGIIKQPMTYTYESMIKDMHTSRDQGHIFVLTEQKLYKSPIESCSSFKSCGDCTASQDPYCGWCMLENRCSKHSMCDDSYVWIPASSTSQCPSVLKIHPNLISARDIDELRITLSHKIQAPNVSCVFSNEQFTRNLNVQASLADENTGICKPDLTTEDRKAIEGSITISVSITTPLSTSPIMTGYFSVYNCETIKSCSQCTNDSLICMWNKQRATCNYATSVTSVNTNPTLVTKLRMCPQVDKYTLLVSDGTEQPIKNSADGLWYLSKDDDYKLTMTGKNLPEPSAFSYSCKISLDSTQTIWINETVKQKDKVTCEIKKEEYQILGYHGELNATIQFMWKSSEIDGEPLKAVVYECESLSEASDNCGLCKSFATSQPHYHCKWCESACIYSQNYCNDTDTQCPNPEIETVYPLSVAVNANVQVEIEGRNLGSVFNDTINAVTIAGIPCQSIEALYDPARRIVCDLQSSNIPIDAGKVKVTLANNASGEFSKQFSFRVPKIKNIVPEVGPYAGGTLITLTGDYLTTGRLRTISVGGKRCITKEATTKPYVVLKRRIIRVNNETLYAFTPKKQKPSLTCHTQAWNIIHGNTTVNVTVEFDGVRVLGGDDVSFTYVTNPTVTDISPLKSFASGGRNLTVKGTNLYAIQTPRIYAMMGEKRSRYESCSRISWDEIICPSPSFRDDDLPRNGNRAKRSNVGVGRARLGFIMDDVSSLLADNLPTDIAGIVYYPDPVIYNLTKTKDFTEIQDDNLVIKGKGLDLAATREDVTVKIGCFFCNVTDFTTETILCKPQISTCDSPTDNTFKVQVFIGYYKRVVGEVKYQSVEPLEQVASTTKIIVGIVIALLVLGLIVAGIVLGKMMKKKKNMKKEITIKMDKLEANFRNQCREEFANLQTAVSDLTADLEGGNVLFREYSVYADKTLFTSHKTEVLKDPPTEYSEQTDKAMDTFKGLLLNTQFLLMFIKTLEKQKSFTIHDKSSVATILMILNHNNMEYITGILASLLNDLVDKNIASGTPKLLLRRSESVAEKLLTHWLSICMYHDLKGKTGSALYILYKAMKIQTEKGPIDYITNCGKYTLSEDKLFTFGDKDINPVTLSLQVKHSSDTDDQENQIQVNVLDCDTITQAKGKMLDIFYKNVPYSQRPSVHSTTIEVEENDGGTKRMLNDEDASSEKDGIWKRINTLQHYKINDRATVILSLNKEMEKSCKSLIGVGSPDSYIVGSFRKAKPAVRTISGSNFWHLTKTKEHQTDAEATTASDLFLPRLTTTKMTLQPYIDDLFTTLLSMEDEPSIIIKYLFDFLDMSASRCGVTDPDVVHTWKCNSLLLRFWVNIIKNPEFVFDVHKPVLVDSCLSVVAQTLMDSCSTADLIFSKSLPSNKLLFAKDIPRYKAMVRSYFQSMKEKPAVSDQDLNSFLTQKVSQKFSGNFNTQRTLVEMFTYAFRYKDKLCAEMDNLEASSPGSFSPLSSKLQGIFMGMEKK